MMWQFTVKLNPKKDLGFRYDSSGDYTSMSVVNYFKIEFDFDNTIIIPDFACPKKYFWFSSVFRKSNLWIKVSVVNIFNETFRFLEKFTIIINIYLNWLYKNYLVLLFIKVPSKTKNLFKMVGYNYFFF